MITPFLIRDVFIALPAGDQAWLNKLVLGLIAIAVATGVIGVLSTYLSNVVGQRVMHDLRSAVYRHLQRLSLAFFTRTRTGEIQSRIANDIGGIQSVVTSTATSIVSNVATVVAAVIAMFLLSWQLAIFSLILLPFFVLLSRRVGSERRRITTRMQSMLADMSTLVEESLSVSGILLGKTMGRGTELAQRFERESENLANLEVKSRMAGRWVMASIQMSFSIMPALVYWYAGFGDIDYATVIAFTTLQTRLFFPLGSLLSVGVDVQTSLALFDRIFEYLDLPVEIDERPDAVPLPPCRGDVTFDGVWFRYDAGCAVDARERVVRRARRDANGHRRRDRVRQDDARLPRRAPLRGRPRTRAPGRDRHPRRDLRVARRDDRSRLAGDVPLPRDHPREPALREAARRPTRRSRRRRARRTSTS